MARLAANKLSGGNWISKVRLLLILTMAFSIFICGGFYPARQADAAVTSLNAWTNLLENTNPGTIGYTTTTTNLFTKGITGTNRVTLAGVCVETAANATISSITVRLDGAGGTPLTQIGTLSGTGQREQCYMGWLPDASVSNGTHALYLTMTMSASTITGVHIWAATYAGVDQTTPVTDWAYNNAGSATVTFGSQVDHNANSMTTFLASAGNVATAVTQNDGFTIVASSFPPNNTDQSTSTGEVTNATAGNFPAGTDIVFTGASGRSAIVVASLNPLVDNTPPTVTINQAVGQADPTGSSPINFAVVFSEAINPATFTGSDVTLAGTAGATAVTLTTSDNITWNAAVSGMSASGTVIVSIAANAVQDPAGNNSTASTSTDNTVTWTLGTYTKSCANGGKDGPATIAGIVNTYYPGNGNPAAGATSIPVGALDARGSGTAISAGDLLLVIQMQDADINASNNATYGDGQNAGSGYTALNQTGLYEYVIATGPVAAGSVPIQGSGAGNGLVNSFRTRAYVAGTNGQSTFQVIRVPQYSASTIAAATTVTAPVWNGGTGGVVVMDIAGTLTIDGTIDVNGLGFRGGMGRVHSGNGAYANTDYVRFSSASPGAGAHASKGEGVAGTPRYVNQPAAYNGAPAQVDTTVEGYPNGSYGRGAPGNAGGGGTDGNAAANDENSGGGGGANYGWGGKGGNSWQSNINVGGEGGSYVTGLAYNRVVLGGGGGAGSTNNATSENFTFTNPPGLACNLGNGVCSSGAPGGGIVILRTKAFTGNGSVTAEGGDAYNVGNDSAGGGGAGGSIVLDSQLGGVVTASVRGGDGGNAWRNGGATLADRHGPGGGGGGGFLAYSPQSGLVVLATIDGGINGKTTTLTDYYGTTSSDGGITIFESPTVSGPKSGAACLPVLTVSKSTTTPIISGLPGTAAYTIRVANDTGKSTAQQVMISDALPGVPALFTNASNPPTSIAYTPNSAPCNTSRTSTTDALTGISNPAWSSWDIPEACEVAVTFNVTVPAGTVPTTYQNPATATYLNPERTTTTGTKSITYNPSSSTAEDVTVLAPPSISEAFGATSILTGASTTLTMTLYNPNSSTITALGFTNTLPTTAEGAPGNMTLVNTAAPGDDPSTTCGGIPVYTAVDGSGSFTVSGLTIPAGGSCTVTITVTAPTKGIYVDTVPAGAISSSSGTNISPATASLLVGDVTKPNVLMPPSMTKSFLTNPLLTGGSSVLRFVLTNPNPATAIGSAGFIDTLPTELVISTPNGLSNGCGGTVTAAAATNYISLNTNGTIPAGGSCTIDVNVTARYPGLYQNTSGQVVGDTGTGNRASDTLRVMAPIVVDKDFVTNPIATATATVLRITLTNPNSVAVTGASLTDTYPTGLVNTGTPSPATSCGGGPTLTAVAGGTSLAVGGTGATIPANSSCTVTVNVEAASGGSYTNSTGAVTTTNAGTAPSASSTLNVLFPPQVRKVFSPDLISNGGQSGMQIIISNPASNAATLTGVALSDTYTGNMTNAAAGTVLCTEGSSATLTGGAFPGTTVGISGGSILPGGSCMITQLVTAATNNTNTTSAPTSTNGGTGVAATAVLKIMQPLLVAKSFANSRPAAATPVVMTITLTNPNPDIVKNITFRDSYPANLTNTGTPNPQFSPANCLGTGAKLTASAAPQFLDLSNGMMYPNTTCSITVNVQLAANTSVINATGPVTTANAGTSPGDSATISTGTGTGPIELSKTFTPATINVGATSVLGFTITKPAGSAAAAIAFTDVLPAGLSAVNTGVPVAACGGTYSITGSNTITLTGGALAAGGSCSFNVTVTGTAAGPYVNRTGQITATGQTGNFAEAAIEVKTAPSVGKSFGAAYMAPGSTNQLTIRIDNPNSSAITTTASFTDLFPTSPGTMTLANGFVTNNSCDLSVWDSDLTTDTSLIYAPSASPVGVLTDFGAGNVASATGSINQVLSGAFVVPAGTSRLLLVVVELETTAAANTVTVNTATYGGQNLTQLYMTPAGTLNRIYVGYLKEKEIAAALSTTLTVSLTNGVAPTWTLMKAGVFSNVNQIKPFTSSPDPGGNQYVANFNDTAAAAFNFGATPLTVKNNGRAMYFSIFNTGATTATIPAGFTAEMFDHTSDAGNAFRVEGGYKTIVADGTETGTNITLSAAQRYGVVGLALQPNTYTGTGTAGVRIPSGTSIPAGGCEFTVNVTASAAGIYTNTIAVSALQTNAGNNATAASTSLTIPKLGPLVTETFLPATINAGGTSRLIITFENPNAVPISLTSLFTDTLPAGVVLSGTPNLSTTCSGGTAGTTAADNVTLSSGAIIPAGTFEVPGSCTLSVDVTAAVSGIYTDTIPAGDLQTTGGNNADPASAVLTVTAITPPTVSKAFDAVGFDDTGIVSKLTLTLSNTNASTATLTADLVDTFPINLLIATPGAGITGTCTGTVTTANIAGPRGTITYASGSAIPPGGCTIVVGVTGTVIATYVNTISAGALQTTLGNNPGPTSDTLIVYPTLVTLSDFRGYVDKERFIIRWSTSSETDTAGFFLFRLDEKTGRYRQINSSLLPALMTSQQGGTYSLVDNGALLTRSNTYILVEIEGKGTRTAYGPFTVTAGGGNAAEAQYTSGTADPGRLLDNNVTRTTGSPAVRTSGKITKYLDSEGTLVVTYKGSKSSANSVNAAADEVSDYVRKARPVSAAKKARISSMKEAEAGARLLRGKRIGSEAKISVNKEGLYYLDAAEISPLLGIPLDRIKQLIKTTSLALSNKGSSVPYLPAGNYEGIFFYGQGIESLYTRDNIYWLNRDRGLQMRSMDGDVPAPVGQGSFSETVHAEDDKVILATPDMEPDLDYWFWEYLFVTPGYTDFAIRSFSIEADSVADISAEASLTVNLKGFTSTSHHARISLNNSVIAEAWMDGTEAKAVAVQFDQKLLHSGANTVMVEAVIDPGVPYSSFYVDSFDLTYRKLYEASGNVLLLRAESSEPLTIYGFTNPDIYVFDITDPSKPMFNLATAVDGAGGNYSASFVPSPGARYMATTADAAATVSNAWVDDSSTLSSKKNVADYIVITTGALAATARSLADYRQKQGLKAMVVELEDIMDEFNYGLSSPRAIQDFLAYAYYNWAKPPRYVVLAGEGTYDYKNNQGFGDNLIPTMIVQTPLGLFPSDNAFADVDGDHVPDMAIGRLPVLTAGELQTLIEKIITYEKSPGNLVVMTADNPDKGGDFPADSDNIAALIPANYFVEKFYLSPSQPLDSIRQKLLTGLSSNTFMLNYIGHAGIDRLAQEGLLRVSDVKSMQNKVFVLTAMTCMTGQFAVPGYDSLSEVLLLHQNGGAVAVWAPSGQSYNALSATLNRAFYASAFRDDRAVLGDSVLKAFRDYGGVYGTGTTTRFMLDMYNLQGDPALRIR
ncbi:MAG: hypothetical protein C0402_08205 [Thermodesulfovibrio sp.]|nr:hypothetical protein [Thermodesulfovibrio sp.]